MYVCMYVYIYIYALSDQDAELLYELGDDGPVIMMLSNKYVICDNTFEIIAIVYVSNER